MLGPCGRLLHRVALRFLTQERLQAAIQRLAVGVREVHKPEGLHPSLCRPHGKEHLRIAMNCRLVNVERQFNFELFIQRLLEVNDAARGRQLMNRPPALCACWATSQAPAPIRAA